jgi:hypothetical protein
MSTARIAKTLLAGLFCTALLSLGHAARWPASGVASAPRAVAQKKVDAPAKGEKADEKLRAYFGASTCVQCHTRGPGGRYTDQFVLLTEYATWRTQDKHSFAYLALLGPRGRRMGELLGIEPVKDDSCLNCHAMNFPEQRRGEGFSIADGVSCDGCHGPSSEWMKDHTFQSWRLKTAAEKEEKGMRNLRDPVVRAQVCTSCHVGNADEGKVITHAMYAAGHPPLPNFELATFSRNLPQHWRDRRDVPFLINPLVEAGNAKIDKDKVQKEYHMASADHQQAQLVTASSLVCLRSSMGLVAARSNLKDKNEKIQTRIWPEIELAAWKKVWNDTPLPDLWPQFMMGQADCYACHHELQRPSWRQLRGYSGPPGRPQVQSWPKALGKLGIGLDGDDVRGQFSKQLDAVHAACNARPFGDPAQLTKATGEFARWTGERIGPLGLADTKLDRIKLLYLLCSVPADSYPDYDSARQIASAIYVLSEPKDAAERRKLVDELAQDFNLRRTPGRTARLELMKQQYQQLLNRKLLTDRAAVRGMESISDHSLPQTFPLKEPDAARAAVGEQVRQFLAAINDGDKPLADMLQDPKNNSAFLDALHEINEKELAEAMDKVPAYDPVAFKKRLETLRGLLPKE